MKTIITMLAAVLLTLPGSAQQRSANSKKVEPANNAVTFSFGDIYRGAGLNYERYFDTREPGFRVSARFGFGSGQRRNREYVANSADNGILVGSGLLYGKRKWKLQGEAMMLLMKPYPATDVAIGTGICRLSKSNSALVKMQWIYFPYEQEVYRHGFALTFGVAF
jgi:hypothetical protein